MVMLDTCLYNKCAMKFLVWIKSCEKLTIFNTRVHALLKDDWTLLQLYLCQEWS